MNDGVKVFTNYLSERPPEYEQTECPYVSVYRKHGDDFEQEFVYTPDGWIPTWKLTTREDLDRMESYDRIDIVFEVFIREGSIIKRVVRQNGKTITRLFVFTRFGLIEQLYDYERGVYVIGKKSERYYALKTGLKIEDVSRN